MGFKARSTPSGTKFMFLTIGFAPPSPEDMAAWGAFFKSLGNRIVDQGGFWGGGIELSKKGSKDLPFGKDSITGFVIFTAKDIAEAEALAKNCPVVASNQLYEIKTQ